jgi:hypothetical protein
MKDIDDFDIAHIEHPDPGMLLDAPYHEQHVFAMKIERMICEHIGLNWEKYDASFGKLKYR